MNGISNTILLEYCELKCFRSSNFYKSNINIFENNNDLSEDSSLSEDDGSEQLDINNSNSKDILELQRSIPKKFKKMRVLDGKICISQLEDYRYVIDALNFYGIVIPKIDSFNFYGKVYAYNDFLTFIVANIPCTKRKEKFYKKNGFNDYIIIENILKDTNIFTEYILLYCLSVYGKSYQNSFINDGILCNINKYYLIASLYINAIRQHQIDHLQFMQKEFEDMNILGRRYNNLYINFISNLFHSITLEKPINIDILDFIFENGYVWADGMNINFESSHLNIENFKTLMEYLLNRNCYFNAKFYNKFRQSSNSHAILKFLIEKRIMFKINTIAKYINEFKPNEVSLLMDNLDLVTGKGKIEDILNCDVFKNSLQNRYRSEEESILFLNFGLKIGMPINPSTIIFVIGYGQSMFSALSEGVETMKHYRDQGKGYQNLKELIEGEYFDCSSIQNYVDTKIIESNDYDLIKKIHQELGIVPSFEAIFDKATSNYYYSQIGNTLKIFKFCVKNKPENLDSQKIFGFIKNQTYNKEPFIKYILDDYFTDAFYENQLLSINAPLIESGKIVYKNLSRADKFSFFGVDGQIRKDTFEPTCVDDFLNLLRKFKNLQISLSHEFYEFFYVNKAVISNKPQFYFEYSREKMMFHPLKEDFYLFLILAESNDLDHFMLKIIDQELIKGLEFINNFIKLKEELFQSKCLRDAKCNGQPIIISKHSYDHNTFKKYVIYACQFGKLNIVQYLLNNHMQLIDEDLFLAAIKYNKKDIFHYLLNFNNLIKITLRKGFSIYILELINSDNIDLLEIYLDNLKYSKHLKLYSSKVKEIFDYMSEYALKICHSILIDLMKKYSNNTTSVSDQLSQILYNDDSSKLRTMVESSDVKLDLNTIVNEINNIKKKPRKCLSYVKWLKSTQTK